MISIMSLDDQIIVDLSNYRTFFSIAINNFSQLKILITERNSRAKKHNISDDDIDFICEKNDAIQRYAMKTVVFSIMSIESFINNYGIENFSRSYFDNYLDKLDIKSKWVIYPRLVTGKQIDTDSQAFELLGKTIALRNRLVHDKARKKPVSKITDSDWITELDAKDSIDTVRKLVKELANLDKNIDEEWLNDISDRSCP